MDVREAQAPAGEVKDHHHDSHRPSSGSPHHGVLNSKEHQ